MFSGVRAHLTYLLLLLLRPFKYKSPLAARARAVPKKKGSKYFSLTRVPRGQFEFILFDRFQREAHAELAKIVSVFI